MARMRWSLLVVGAFALAFAVSLGLGIWLDDNRCESVWPGAVDMMKILPADVGDFNYADVSMFPARWWEDSEWKEHYGEGFLGQSWEKARNRAYCDDHNIWLWSGSFNLDSIRELLGSDYEEYRDVRVWVYEHYSTAIINDVVVIAHDDVVRRCIDVAKGGELSLYGCEDYRGVLDRLPRAVSVAVWAPTYRADVLAMGVVRVDEDGTRRETTVYKYVDADSARNAADEARANWERASEEGQLSDDLIDFKVAQDGQYVTIVSQREGSSNV